MQFNCKRRQGGMAILSMIFVAIGLVAVLASYLVYSKTSNTSSVSTSSPVSASLIEQGASLRDGAQMMQSKGISLGSIYTSTTNGVIASAATIIQGAGSNNGSWMYDATNGGTARLDVMPDAMANQATNPSQWVIKTSSDDATSTGSAVVKIKGVGADATADLVAAAYDLKLSVCQAINTRLNSAAATATPPASGKALSAWQTPGTAVDLSAGIAGIDGVMQGCVGTSDSKYVYYMVLQAY